MVCIGLLCQKSPENNGLQELLGATGLAQAGQGMNSAGAAAGSSCHIAQE
jgi:hypothetical protein